MWILPNAVCSALTRLEQAGCEAYIVGGCVRDLWMGRQPSDYDITTAALPEETMAVFAGERIIETGLQHGTVTVLLQGQPLEITTFRVDGSYADGRHPDAVRFTPSLREDLARRDFTVNAMAWSPLRGLCDPFDGQGDIARGLLRCVGIPRQRFAEDALRILRALRFSAVLGFRIAPETELSLREAAPLLKRISPERVAAELKKLVCGPEVFRVVTEEVETLGSVLPELLPLRGFDQRNPHHCYDVLEHSAAAAAQIAPEPVLRLAALFHDLGKPDCFTVGEDGIGHAYGHAERSAELTDAILERLRFDRHSRECIVTLVRRHDVQIEDSEKAVRRALHRLTPELFFQLLALKRADNLAQAPEYRGRQAYYDRLEALAHGILEAQPCLSLRELAIRGNELGLPPGPAVGAALSALLNAVLDGSVPNEKAALLDYYRAHFFEKTAAD